VKYILCLILYVIATAGMSCKNNDISGLVAQYKFTGNARAHGSNDNNGRVHGAELTPDRFEQENAAYKFNGVNAIITADVTGMPQVNALQSFSWWFKSDTLPSFKHDLDAHNMIALVDTNDGVGIQFGFRAMGYNSLGFDVWYWGGGTVMESDIPAVDEWHHCVYIFDGKQHLFYIDGKKSAESLAQPQTGTPDMLMFGNYPGGDQYFAGSLDDVRIFNRKISLKEIHLLFTEKEL
jgi:hypothetical protein